MLDPAELRPSSQRWWTTAAAVAVAVGAWDLALFLFIGGVAPSRALLARAALLDAALAFPVAALALWLAQPLSRRLAGAARRWSGLASAALPALAFGVLLVPAAALREGVVALTAGATAGLAGAGDALSPPLDAGRWLCTAVVGPAVAPSAAARDTLAASARAALLLQVPALPAFFAALALARRRSAAGHAIMLVAALGASGALVLATKPRAGFDVAQVALGPGCQPGLDVRMYSVSAVEVDPRLPGGQRSPVRVFAVTHASPFSEPALGAARGSALPDRASPGPAGDLAQPLVIHAALGECLHVVFTNRLSEGPAAFRVHGLPHLTTLFEATVALPPDYEVRPGETVTYSFQIPFDPEWARAYLVEGGAKGGATRRGPLATLVVERRGSTGVIDAKAHDAVRFR